MKERLKAVNNENGQVLVLLALLMVALMGAAALVVDVGMVQLTKMKMQNAADAAALAGAQDLSSASTAISTAKNYAHLNGADMSNTTVTTPYHGDPTKIKVVCTTNVQYTFARVLGLNGTNVSASAVAQKTDEVLDSSGPFNYVLFSGNGAVNFNGNKHNIIGNVYGKTGINIPGDQSTMTGNAVSASNSNNIIVPSGAAIISNTTVPFPTNLPDLIEAQGTKLTNHTIADGTSLNGIYYIDGDLTINGRIKGTAIIYASGKIIFASGIEQTNADSVMFYTNGSFTFNGGSGDIYGILYAPNGGFTNNGGPNGDIYGRIITNNSITVNGAKFSATSSPNDLNSLKLLKDTSIKLVE